MQNAPYRPQTISQFLNRPTSIYHMPDTLNPALLPTDGDVNGTPYPGYNWKFLNGVRQTFHSFVGWISRPGRQG